MPGSPASDHTYEAPGSRPVPTANDTALRFLSALTQLTVAMPVGVGSRVDIERAAGIIRSVVPGIDLMATWFSPHAELVVRYRSERHRQVPPQVSFSPTQAEREYLAAGPLALPKDAGARLPEAIDRARISLGLQSVALLPVNLSDKQLRGLLLFGACTNRPFNRVELAFLEAVAAQIARRLEAERARRYAEQERTRLAAVIDTLPEPLMIVDGLGQLITANHAAAELLAIGDHDFEPGGLLRRLALQPAAGRPGEERASPLERALSGETVRSFAMQVQLADGREHAMLASSGPLHDSGGAVCGAVLLLQDVSQMREFDHLKDEFINTVSHELRTPTTTIRGGALTLLKRGAMLPDDVRGQLLQDIADESERLHHLVEDLLTLSRSRAGMQLAPEPLRLHRVVNKVIVNLGSRLGNHQLLVDVPPDLPMADADPLALEQVLRNLIENAARHTMRGGPVEVVAAARGRDLLVSVRDHGPGIPPEDRERVFEPFSRLPASIQSATQGAGLGLAVCRRLVEMAGGRIWVEPGPAGGTAICFTVAMANDSED